MRRLLLIFCALALALCVRADARAQTSASPVRVYLMTMGPGEAVWERFGHNALWIHIDGESDIAYNWGLFDFDQPGFIRRFLLGRMTYWMAGFDAELTTRAFAGENRSVWAQELNLSEAQKRQLIEFVHWNEREENRFYRYDYYRDNCSTRVRDAIDRVLGGQIAAQLKPKRTQATYRSHTRLLTMSDVPIYTGLELLLGEPVDRPLSAWEETFLPMELRAHLREVQVRNETGELVPLVLSERTLFEAARAPLPTKLPSRTIWYLLGACVFAALLVALAVGALHGSRAARITYGALATVTALVLGVLGTIVAFLWIFTDHAVAYRNENVFQATPLGLVLAVAIALSVFRRRRPQLALKVALAAALLSVLGFVIQVLPALDQVNGEIIALALPIHAGLALSLVYFNRRLEPER